jgi:hypothetical protein
MLLFFYTGLDEYKRVRYVSSLVATLALPSCIKSMWR